MQKFILAELDSKGFWLKEIIKLLAEKSQHATAVNPVTGEIEQSDAVQLSYLKEILNIAKLRQASTTNFFGKINLNKIIYGLK